MVICTCYAKCLLNAATSCHLRCVLTWLLHTWLLSFIYKDVNILFMVFFHTNFRSFPIICIQNIKIIQWIWYFNWSIIEFAFYQKHLSLTFLLFLDWRVIINKTWKCKRKPTASAVKVISTGSLFQQPAKLKHIHLYYFCWKIWNKTFWQQGVENGNQEKNQLQKSSYI